MYLIRSSRENQKAPYLIVLAALLSLPCIGATGSPTVGDTDSNNSHKMPYNDQVFLV